VPCPVECLLRKEYGHVVFNLLCVTREKSRDAPVVFFFSVRRYPLSNCQGFAWLCWS
jgi:hypothetical protein